MATRSRIAYRLDDGRIVSVYCHWDGDLDGNGSILAEHYQDPAKVEKLIEGGDFSSLAPEVNDVSYYSKRGEVCPQKVHPDLPDYLSEGWDVQYYYLFEKGAWRYTCEGRALRRVPGQKKNKIST